MGKKYDFSGWATRNNLLCSDGRTIRKDAFAHQDGVEVPLVWNHQHGEVGNVLGHALLHNRPEGVYADCTFNDTQNGRDAKLLVQHGDITSLSIYANKLKQIGKDVMHGTIREVSLVLAGANPGAVIDTILEHSDGSIKEGIFYLGEEDCDLMLEHSDDSDKKKKDEDEDAEEDNKKDSDEDEEEEESEPEDNKEDEDEDEKMKHSDENSNEKTVEDVFNSMTEEQKTVCYAIIGQAVEDAKKENGGNENMKHNVFDNEEMQEDVLSHSDVETIFRNAKSSGSLKQATEDYLAHMKDSHGNNVDYGIADIDYLFPEYKNVTEKPEFVSRDMDWVTTVMNGVKHVPFTRIKSMFADITMDEARAKGYMKGNRKEEEVFGLMKRTTDPQTIYKKQKLDRDDILDITDFDVVAWLKAEMRIMLNEEIARAVLIGDGRSAVSPDKIHNDHIRNILNDDEFYSYKVKVAFVGSETEDERARKVIRSVIKARKNYKGSGNPTLFTTEDWVTDMLLIEDKNGRIIYESVNQLATALRVSKIVTVPVMEGCTREDDKDHKTYETIGIIVNLSDYYMGADKGGNVSLFDDFDIDYNQYKYLIETRCSGALVKYHSALVIETEQKSTQSPAPAPEQEAAG